MAREFVREVFAALLRVQVRPHGDYISQLLQLLSNWLALFLQQ